MKVTKFSAMNKTLRIIVSVVLIASMIPICAVQNAEIAMADEAETEQTQEGDWYFWSDIYPSEKQALNTKDAYTDEDIQNGVNKISDEEISNLDFVKELARHIVNNSKDSKNNSVFETEATSTVSKDGDEFLTQGGVSSLSTDSKVMCLNGKTPVLIGGSSDNGENISCTIQNDTQTSFSIKFSLEAKKAGATDDTQKTKIVVTANVGRRNVLTGTTITFKSNECSIASYTTKDSISLKFENAIKTPKIYDVKAKDAKSVSDLLNKRLSGIRDVSTGNPENGLNLIYSDYKMDDVVVQDESQDIATISLDKDDSGYSFKVLGKKRVKSVKSSLNLYVENGGNKNYLFDENQSFELTINKGKVYKKSKDTDLITLDYRYADDQVAELRKSENLDKFVEQYKDLSDNTWSGSDLIDPNSITLTKYPDAALDITAQQECYLSFKLKSECAEEFEISGSEAYKDAQLEFKVNVIKESKVDNLDIVGKLGDGSEVSPVGDNWASGNVKITWEGHKLKTDSLPETKDGFEESIVPKDQNSGVKVIDKIYAKDTSTNVITKVSDATFNIDNNPPVVTQMSVDTHESTGQATGILDKIKIFFFGKDKKSDVEMLVSDGSEAGKVSGFAKNDEVTIAYDDNGGNKEPITTKLLQNKTSSSSHLNDNFKFSVSGTHDILTDSFKVAVKDRARNSAVVTPQNMIPAEVMRLVMNSNKPTVKVDFDNNDVKNGSFYDKDRTATVTITDDHFDYIQTYASNQVLVTYSVDGHLSYAYPKDFENVGGTTWVWKQKFSMDADYALNAQVTNLANEQAKIGEQSWTIDKTAPSANVVWDNENAENGNYYSAPRTATVTITEHNFDGGTWKVVPTGDAGRGSEYSAPSVDSWTHYGDSHICHVTFPAQGKFSMTIDGEDSAKNQMQTYTVSEFIVDSIQPEISISVNGEANATSHAYTGKADVSVTIADANVDSLSEINVDSISWNGSATPYVQDVSTTDTVINVTMADPEYVPESDGVYRITINAKDLAGNTQTQTLDWSVNRFGSTYVVSDSTKGIISRKYIKYSDMSDVLITEINPSGIQEDTAAAKVAKGTNTHGVQRGSGFTFATADDANGWPAYSYRIEKGQYSSDAMYQTIVSSTDTAGRVSDNTMAAKSSTRENSADVTFAVDSTAPIVTFSGFDDGVVAGTSHKVNAYIEDNMKLDRAVIEVNGKEVQTLDATDLGHKDHELTLSESSDTQTVTVKAYDAAGNISSVDSSSIFINSDPLARLMHNPALMATLIISLATLIGILVWFFFIFKRRKKDEEEEEEGSATGVASVGGSRA